MVLIIVYNRYKYLTRWRYRGEILLKPNHTGYVFSNTANIYYQIFEKQISPISKLYKIITIDSRGHGRSSFGLYPLTIDIMAEDAIAVMDELKIEKANIIGFSDGGNIAIQMAIKHPDRITKLILAGANLYPTGMKMLSQLPMVMAYLFYKFFSIFSRSARKKAYLLDLMVNQPSFDLKELEGIQLPTLVLAGEKDVIKKEHTQLIADLIPQSQLQIIENANHFIFNNEPEKVNLIILSYLYEDKK